MSMKPDSAAIPVGMLAAFLIGVYVGIFTSEANAVYGCIKDGATTISGALWKKETRLSCASAKAEEQRG